jgi:hypothetical protein
LADIAAHYADFKVGLHQGFTTGEMGFNDKFALQKILNGPCPLWVLAVL